jgi:hypothetical protein
MGEGHDWHRCHHSVGPCTVVPVFSEFTFVVFLLSPASVQQLNLSMQAFFHAAVLLGRGTAAGLVDIDTTFAEFYASVVASGRDVSD